ncbi:MAG: hypothetical protein ACK5B9_10545 [Flavobacteriia bacterium]|jgi:hypothetical protein
MKTKKYYSKKISAILIIVLLSVININLFAQEKGPKRGEKIKQLKIAYITEQLNLTVAESEKFWPVYNEMELKLKNNRKENKKVIDDLSNNVETFTDEDFKKNVNKLFDNDIAQTTIRKDYYTKIAAVIGYKKATKLLKVEKDFKQKLVKELKKRRDEKVEPKK